MNPPSGTRKARRRSRKARRRSFTAAQLRAQRLFKARFGGKKKKARRRRAHSRKRLAAKSTRRVQVVFRSSRRATTMPRKSRRRSRRRSGGFARRGFSLIPFRKDMLPDAIGLAIGAIATPLLVNKFGGNFTGANAGAPDPKKLIVAKVIAGGAMAAIAGMLKQPRLGRAIATGTIANAMKDVASQVAPTYVGLGEAESMGLMVNAPLLA